MTFPYKHVLLIGATAGIGRAMADRLVAGGAKVTAVGRRQNRLDEFVAQHGGKNVNGVAFDIAELDKIPEFAAQIMTQFPDVDSIFLNAGIQWRYNIGDPKQFDLDKFNDEIKINFTSFVVLVHAFLPYLLQKEHPTSIIFTGSNLAIIPAAVMPGYSASKAALNSFTLCLREQLKPTSIRVIEISPPPVQTELHDYLGLEAGRQLGMPVDAFTDQAYQGLTEGKDQIVIGTIGPADTFNEIIDKRRTAFENLAEMMRKRH